MTLPGPDYTIGAALGETVGHQLFHKFHEFNPNTIETETGMVIESATFSGPSDINAIVARVTGPNTSNINGLLRSEIAGATFYLITATFGSRPGGNITVDTSVLRLNDGGMINSTRTGTGIAGNITVNARGSVWATNGSSMTTSAVQSSGGNIAIHAVDTIMIRDSVIAAQAQQNGGNVMIDPRFVILNSGQVIANAILGNGGNISIDAGVFLASQDSVIDASSRFGRSGNVVISSPTNDLSGSLVKLPEALLDAVAQLSQACNVKSTGEFSSFVVVGRGGLPMEPGPWLPGFHLTIGVVDGDSRLQAPE